MWYNDIVAKLLDNLEIFRFFLWQCILLNPAQGGRGMCIPVSSGPGRATWWDPALKAKKEDKGEVGGKGERRRGGGGGEKEAKEGEGGGGMGLEG